jgi:hypothetical protein
MCSLASARHRSSAPAADWLLERRERVERALTTVVASSYLLGVSTQRMEKLVETLGTTRSVCRSPPVRTEPAGWHSSATSPPAACPASGSSLPTRTPVWSPRSARGCPGELAEMPHALRRESDERRAQEQLAVGQDAAAQRLRPTRPRRRFTRHVPLSLEFRCLRNQQNPKQDRHFRTSTTRVARSHTKDRG